MLTTHDKVAGDGPAARVRIAPATRYDILVAQREDEIARRVARAQAVAATPFQNEGWLRAWYATIGRAAGTPLLVTAIDRRSGELAAMLPLLRRTDGRLRVIAFADEDVSDSNAPILGAAAPTRPDDALALWAAIRRALTDADIVRFTKMPGEIEGRVNPLTLLPSARRSALSRNTATIAGSFEDYLGTLKGSRRKQLRKCWRLFTQHEGATFRRVEDPGEAVRVFGVLEERQGARLRQRGESYRLDQSAFSAFYRTATAEGVADGSVVLTALMHGDEIVAALLGVARGDTYVMVRICADAERWAQCSPGNLLIVKTMESLHAEGYRLFDFSVGDYEYKRRLGAQGEPLFEITTALTTRGLPFAAYDRAKQAVRDYPAVRALAHRIIRPRRPAATPATGDDRD